MHTTNWDLVIFDEYHFGALGRTVPKALLNRMRIPLMMRISPSKYDVQVNYDETWLPITTTYYLYLSGTLFRALNSGEFIEEQIYNWTYSDEQQTQRRVARREQSVCSSSKNGHAYL